MNDAARRARNEYQAKWRKAHPDKVKAATEKYWTRKAAEKGLVKNEDK